MALSLAIPLFGLNNDYFSALNAKLLNIERERNLQNSFDSGRDSPSTGSETSGISSFITSAESTPISSRSETPIDVFCRNQDNNNKVNITLVFALA
ncbi:hypothetical protein X777_10667 [Ooceraea biroi]|uniref:Uncharacterized protein n=1 Tax=Ooceraea biroi TaxID=2015173 RepID=A0A026W609_OOCBI|nr:hypothetical protein X777_10667 [Ooceraea biroi]